MTTKQYGFLYSLYSFLSHDTNIILCEVVTADASWSEWTSVNCKSGCVTRSKVQMNINLCRCDSCCQLVRVDIWYLWVWLCHQEQRNVTQPNVYCTVKSKEWINERMKPTDWCRLCLSYVDLGCGHIARVCYQVSDLQQGSSGQPLLYLCRQGALAHLVLLSMPLLLYTRRGKILRI